MKTVAWLVVGTLFLAPITLAQEPDAYSGIWQAKLEIKPGVFRNGTVDFKGREGTWDMVVQTMMKNPCAGLRSPIVIQHASADELVFEIMRSKALKGCKDNIATLKRVDNVTLQGELDDGRKLTLVKE